MEGADDSALLGDRRSGGRVGAGNTAGRLDGGLGEAEIEELRAGFGEHDIGRFKITVDYAAVVRFVESIGDFGADFEDLLDGESAAGNTLGEALAFDAFHDQEICPVL